MHGATDFYGRTADDDFIYIRFRIVSSTGGYFAATPRRHILMIAFRMVRADTSIYLSYSHNAARYYDGQIVGSTRADAGVS